jgi:hypothetical protein
MDAYVDVLRPAITAAAQPAAAPSLTIVYRRSATLTDTEREVVWSFFSRFVERDRRAFEDKLARTREVFLGYRRGHELVAFGAVDVLERTVDGRTHGILFTPWAALHPSTAVPAARRPGRRRRG